MRRYFPIIILFLIFYSCKEPVKLDLSESTIIPKPVSLIPTMSSFELNEKTKIVIQSEENKAVVNYFQSIIQSATGFDFTILQRENTRKRNAIYFALVDTLSSKNEEAYLLNITAKKVFILANKKAGLIRAIQTIRQILPDSIELKSKQDKSWLLASGVIKDFPEYEYRGSMLDVSRHFFSVEDVKRYIDLLCFYKMNVLHLHLSDDQGWRIEIKSWPKLTEIGGSTEVGGGEGGFYTQEQYKDMVSYASERGVTIIPEIDMPGHTNAALASYAELNCNDKATDLYTGTRVGFSSLCVHKEITYQFLDDVIRELSAITPGPYLHIGGDESHVTPKDDYIYFINRVQKIVHKYGKQVIGWDDIAKASLAENTVIQFWQNEKNARNGVKQGAKVIMSPAKKAYLDMKYHKDTKLGLTWAAYIEVDQAYQWRLDLYAKGIEKENIMGIESPLWSETIDEMDELEYLAFPRVIGHAEIGWSQAKYLTWDDYKNRLANHEKRLQMMNVDFYKSPKVPWNSNQ